MIIGFLAAAGGDSFLSGSRRTKAFKKGNAGMDDTSFDADACAINGSIGTVGPPGASGKRHELEMLMLLACAGLPPPVIKSQAVVFGKAKPERLKIPRRQQRFLVLEMPGHNQQVMLQHIELVQNGDMVPGNDRQRSGRAREEEKDLAFRPGAGWLSCFFRASSLRLRLSRTRTKNRTPCSSIKV